MDVVRFETDPDSHAKINYVLILPDMHLKLKLSALGRDTPLREVRGDIARARQ